jgi:kinetochor protein Mis14/NSL1
MDVSPSMLQSILSSDAHSKALEEEYEPYDTRLHERATTLKRQEAELVEEIAMLRRSVPAKVVEARKRGFVDVEKDESVIKSIEEKIEGGEGVTLEGLDKERQETLERSLGVAIGSVAGLTRTLPEVVAKKERAEEVERYVGKREKRGKK